VRYKRQIASDPYFLARVTLFGIPEDSLPSDPSAIVAAAARVLRTGAAGAGGGGVALALLDAVGAVSREPAAARVARLGTGAVASSGSVLLLRTRDAAAGVARVRGFGFSGSVLSAFVLG
jgi:hypothetical protein